MLGSSHLKLVRQGCIILNMFTVQIMCLHVTHTRVCLLNLSQRVSTMDPL